MTKVSYPEDAYPLQEVGRVLLFILNMLQKRCELNTGFYNYATLDVVGAFRLGFQTKEEKLTPG